MKGLELFHEVLEGDADRDVLARLHANLFKRASAEGLLDLAYRTVETPVGALLLAASPKGLVRVAFANEDFNRVLDALAARISPRLLYAPSELDPAARQIDEYFSGHRQSFELALDLQLANGFRRMVIETLPQIAYGSTASYTAVANAAGRPRAVRAAGSACANNPLPVVLPCHRVLRSDGSLGGFGGGLEIKRMLLDLEAEAREHPAG